MGFMAAMKPMPETEAIYRLASHVAMESFAEGGLVLRLSDRHLFELNPTALRILELSDGRRRAAEVAAALAEEFEIAFEQAEQDVLSLYADFIEQGMIERVAEDD
jgi:hypothetical protein